MHLSSLILDLLSPIFKINLHAVMQLAKKPSVRLTAPIRIKTRCPIIGVIIVIVLHLGLVGRAAVLPPRSFDVRWQIQVLDSQQISFRRDAIGQVVGRWARIRTGFAND
jgi:hypothetical protein